MKLPQKYTSQNAETEHSASGQSAGKILSAQRVALKKPDDDDAEDAPRLSSLVTLTCLSNQNQNQNQNQTREKHDDGRRRSLVRGGGPPLELRRPSHAAKNLLLESGLTHSRTHSHFNLIVVI